MTNFNFIGSAPKVYGEAFLIQACVGLVIGTFELAFKRIYNQVIFRMFLHLLSVPFGLLLNNYKGVALTQQLSLLHQTMNVLSICILSVGCIGTFIGIIELGFPIEEDLLRRMSIYACFCFVGLCFLPK